MNYELRTNKAFTLIELVVAVALLAMVLSFASVIFRVSIEAYRTAGANTEIMQKLRAITDQLNADFKGQIRNPQGKVLFNYNNKVRSDSIVFFANGDFQSTRQYEDNASGKDKTVVGNVACIYYGLANPSTNKPEEKILQRRQTILIYDPCSYWEDKQLDELAEYCDEEKKSSLSELIAEKFDANDIMNETLELDPNDVNDLVMYMAEGVDDFTIQYVGWDGTFKKFNEWRPENKDIVEWKNKSFSPLAFKFTFTLYDSKGIIENGRRFTHIVYLD